MAVPILVITSTTGFGDLIQQTMQETGHFQIVQVRSSEEAVQKALKTPFALCILDSDNLNVPLSELGSALLKILPDLRLVVVPPNNDLSSPSLIGVPLHGYLSKPFYLPDLLDIVNELLPKPLYQEAKAVETRPATIKIQPSKPVGRPSSPPEWLQDVSLAAQHLTSLSLESAAQAALIVHEGQLWAYAGQLSQPAAQELAANVINHWDHIGGSDLARFIHLGANGNDYMLYATSLGRGMILALAFDAEMPFSKVRSQASRLVNALVTPPDMRSGEKESSSTPETTFASKEPLESPMPDLHSLLDDVPPPTVSGAPTTRSQIEDKPMEVVKREETTSTPGVSIPRKDIEPGKGIPIQAGDTESLADTRPHLISLPEEVVELQPASPAISNLNFACVIIPRLPQHHLTGDLAVRLTEWVGNLCLAFGWRLEHLAVRPDYLHWIVNVPPTTSPSFLLRIIRKHTSQRIFIDFPALAQENPSGDFWASGYLITSISQPLSAEVIREYIQKTRQHQGVVKSSLRFH